MLSEGGGLTLGIEYLSFFKSLSDCSRNQHKKSVLYSTGIWEFFSLTCQKDLCPSFSWYPHLSQVLHPMLICILSCKNQVCAPAWDTWGMLLFCSCYWAVWPQAIAFTDQTWSPMQLALHSHSPGKMGDFSNKSRPLPTESTDVTLHIWLPWVICWDNGQTNALVF